jgi:photosystem II stability/assembly factor-like uncharacterized protein
MKFFSLTLLWIITLPGIALCHKNFPADTTKKKKIHIKKLMSGKDFALNQISFASEEIGYAVGQQCLVLKTKNGGKAWDYLLTSKINNWLYGIWCHTKDSVLLVGESGTILSSENGGHNFKRAVSYTSDTILSISFSGKTGFASGGCGLILKSTDGGSSWKRCKTGKPENLYAVCCVSGKIVYACGRNGSLIKSSDAGNSWYDVSLKNLTSFYSMSFLDSLEGFVAGEGGSIFRTTDGGKTWKQLNTQTHIKIYSVFFINRREGYFAGERGSLFYTEDGGITWTPIKTGTKADLYSLFFFSNNKGYAAGAEGTILGISFVNGEW